MKTTTRLLAALVLSIGLAGGALADVLAGNAPFLGASSGQQSDANSATYSQAFVAPANSTFEAIRWWGFHSANSMGSAYDNFVVSLDGIAQAGTLSVVDGATSNEYTLNIGHVAGAFSQLSIVNNSFDVEWFWQSAAAQGNSAAPDASAVAFSLVGGVTPVPEPHTAAMLLAGLAALGLGKARRTKA